VVCNVDTDCTSDSNAECSSSNTCIPCTSSTHCSSHIGKTVCNNPGSSGVCVQCTDNTTCSGSTPYCDTSANVCRACVNNDECQYNDTYPKCQTTTNYECGICTSDTDCVLHGNNQHCQSGIGNCVECY
jgi:hypothetical protein